MKKLLYRVILKWPIKVLIITAIMIGITMYFVSKITLSTGNETLIDTSTETYIDNFNYQESFGTDPIMIIFEGESKDNLLSFESLNIMNNLVDSLKSEDGIFYINSPIGVIDNATLMAYQNYQTGLNEISSGLIAMSESINSMTLIDPSFDSETLLTTFETLAEAQKTLSTNLSGHVVNFEAMRIAVSDEITRLEEERDMLDPVDDSSKVVSITQTITILTNINNLYDQLITMNGSLSTGAINTADALNQISVQLSTLFSTVSGAQGNITTLASNLEKTGDNVENLARNFNMFKGTFPTSSETLTSIVFPEGEINPMMEMYIVDDTHLYISIILDESFSNDNIESILKTIDDSLKGTIYEDTLVSGKPVLDYDIQSSMMDSMRIMMISAGIIMIVILLVLFPVSARLLPLFIVLLAVITTVGIMGLFTIPLTMVSMAVFPVLIGLGIDYSIQFHNRYMEEDLRGDSNE